MRYPMILPWLARKSGVSVPRAKHLWVEAQRNADHRYPDSVRGSAYWGHALAEFRRRLQAAGGAVSRPAACRVSAADRAPAALVCLQIRAFTQAAAAWTGFLRGASVAWPRLMLVSRRAG